MKVTILNQWRRINSTDVRMGEPRPSISSLVFLVAQARHGHGRLENSLTFRFEFENHLNMI